MIDQELIVFCDVQEPVFQLLSNDHYMYRAPGDILLLETVMLLCSEGIIKEITNKLVSIIKFVYFYHCDSLSK